MPYVLSLGFEKDSDNDNSAMEIVVVSTVSALREQANGLKLAIEC